MGVNLFNAFPITLCKGLLSNSLARGDAFSAFDVPVITAPNPAPRAPLSTANLKRLVNLLNASSLPSAPSLWSVAVGPPITSPIVPKSSVYAIPSPKVDPSNPAPPILNFLPRSALPVT